MWDVCVEARWKSAFGSREAEISRSKILRPWRFDTMTAASTTEALTRKSVPGLLIYIIDLPLYVEINSEAPVLSRLCAVLSRVLISG